MDTTGTANAGTIKPNPKEMQPGISEPCNFNPDPKIYAPVIPESIKPEIGPVKPPNGDIGKKRDPNIQKMLPAANPYKP
ncbi:MAG: hypothetical protein K9L30_09635 [Desulfobacterales bacterium]|nr:hypothetical protein [Desulfobacterales bacterium]